MYRKIALFLSLVAVVIGVSTTSAHAADVDNYAISNYEVEMNLGRDSEQRSTLEVTERITAEFPNYDQNHGLERVFVKEYDGHQTNFQLQSVTDEKGVALNYHWEGDALRIGDAEKYVHGTQTYVIIYTQRDVTKLYSDTSKDEFYWDVIGVEWRVPIRHAEVSLRVDSELMSEVQTDLYCYAGGSGKRNIDCNVTKPNRGFENEYLVTTDNLSSKEGMSIALGFAPGTFAEYTYSPFERLLQWQQQVAIPAGVAGVVVSFIALLVFVTQIRTSKKRLGTIAPEYLPPKDTSITVAGHLLGMQSRIGPAQMIDFAVRHYIKLYELKPKSFFIPAEYEIEIIKDIGDLSSEEKEILTDMFGQNPHVGQRLNLKTLRNNTGYASRVQDNIGKLNSLVRGTYGLREKHAKLKKGLLNAAGVIAIIAVATLSIFLGAAAAWLLVLAFTAYRSTPKGLALERYLHGLKLYIGVGEAERLRYLQSPEGAEKVHEVVDGVDMPKQRIVLYERVLPYAVLFGQEKAWSKQLASLYDQTSEQPGWYHSNTGVFTTAAFASSMGSFSTSTASSASSSTGGSSGGGSSGGGGGGGGGGGW